MICGDIIITVLRVGVVTHNQFSNNVKDAGFFGFISGVPRLSAFWVCIS